MNYQFTTDKVGKITLNNFKSYGKSFTIHGVDAQQSDANIIIGGLNQLLSIVNFQNQYDPADAIRTVNQNVVANQ